MVAAVVGALRVTLGLDSAAFSKGAKQATSRLQSFAKTAAKGLAGIGVAAGAAAAGVGVAVRGVLNDADNLAKVSRQIGVPVEELSRLRHAADLSGVSFSNLQTGVRRLSQNMNDAANGIGEGKEAFDALGIEVTKADGTLKSTTEIMAEMSDAFAGLPDGAQKTALALDLMGRSGAQMIPLLNDGSDSLRSMMAEADALGITITEKTAKSAEVFNDNLNRLSKAFSSLGVQISADLAPVLADFTDWLVSNAPAIRQFIVSFVQALQTVAVGLSNLAQGGQAARETIDAAVEAIVGVFRGMKERVLGYVAGLVRGIHEWFGVRLQSAVDQVSAVGEKITKPFRDAWDAVVGNSYVPDMVKGVEQWLGRLAKSAPDLANDAGEGISDAFSGMDQIADRLSLNFEGIGSSIAGLVTGTKSWKSVLADVLKQVGSISFGGGGAGGGFAGLLTGLIGGLASFNGGGFTGRGSRSGGLDGLGGFLAMLHPNESVIDHNRPSTDLQNASNMVPNFTYAPVNNFTGTGEELSEFKNYVDSELRRTKAEVPATVQRAITTGHLR